MSFVPLIIGFLLFVIGDRLLINIAREIGSDNVLFVRYISMLILCIVHFLFLRKKNNGRTLTISFTLPFILFGISGTLAFSSAFLCSVLSNQLTTFLLICLSPLFGFLIERNNPTKEQLLYFLIMFLLALVVIKTQGIIDINYDVLMLGLCASCLWAFELFFSKQARNFVQSKLKEQLDSVNSYEVETLFSACMIAVLTLGTYILWKEINFYNLENVRSITEIDLYIAIKLFIFSSSYYASNILVIKFSSKSRSYISSAGFYAVIVFTSILYIYDNEIPTYDIVIILLCVFGVTVSGVLYARSKHYD